MRRTSRLSRHAALRTRGRGKRFASYEPNKPYQDFVRARGCILQGRHECVGEVQFCHVKTRGSGGHDEGNGFAGCVAAHDEQGHSILSFERKYGVNLREIAQRLWTEYQGER
jgi:hypothetical protein